jgi:hypothetical protein
VARLPTIRRHKSQSLHSPGNLKPAGSQRGRGNQCPRPTNEINNSAENLGLYQQILRRAPNDSPAALKINRNSIFSADVTNNGRPMNASLSEDSVAETALAKKNSDGKIRGKIVVGFGKGRDRLRMMEKMKKIEKVGEDREKVVSLW